MTTVKEFLQNKLAIKPKKIHKEYKSKLWHATSFENAIQVLKDDVMVPHTSHRFWKDGILRNDKDPEYETSNWMHGWSFTRTKNYATGWNTIIFEFEREKILENFKIKPICWGATIKRAPKIGDIKRETEEFILSGGIKEPIPYYKALGSKLDEEYDLIYDKKIKAKKMKLD